MFTRQEDKVDILINFFIFAILWLIMTWLISVALGKEMSFKKRFAYTGSVVLMIIMAFGYFHFKSINIRMELVYSLLIHYSFMLIVIAQFLIMLKIFIKKRTKVTAYFLAAFSIILISSSFTFIYDTRGLNLNASSLVFFKVSDFLEIISKVVLILATYHLGKYLNKAHNGN